MKLSTGFFFFFSFYNIKGYDFLKILISLWNTKYLFNSRHQLAIVASKNDYRSINVLK